MSKSVVLILTNGFEEIEAITPTDLLRRSGVNVITASREPLNEVKGAHNIIMQADTDIESALKDEYDAIVLPGGPGFIQMKSDARVLNALKEYNSKDKIIGAICAAPVVLKEADVINGRRFTAHFSVEEELPEMIKNQLAVVDGNLVTGNGPGGAIAFALALIKKLASEDKAIEIAKGIGLKDFPIE